LQGWTGRGRGCRRFDSGLIVGLKVIGAERVYVATIGHGIDHLHLQLLPRGPGTPEEIPWHGVDEWAGAHRGAASEIEAIVASLRSHIAT
jgi:hypothetical protein